MLRSALAGLLLVFVSSSLVVSETIDLVVNQSQSSVTATALGTDDTSSVTGTGAIALSPPEQPFGTAQVTALNLSLADGIFLDTGLVDIIVDPDGAMVFFVEVGPPGVVDANNQFDQPGNVFGISGMAFVDLLVGEDMTIDLSTVEPVAYDIVGAQLNLDGTDLTLSATLDLDFEFEVLGQTATMNLSGSFVLEGTIPKLIVGDVNCDGEINLLDVAPFVEQLSSGVYSIRADINGDGSVDLLDVAPFVDLLSG